MIREARKTGVGRVRDDDTSKKRMIGRADNKSILRIYSSSLYFTSLQSLTHHKILRLYLHSSIKALPSSPPY